MAVHVMALRNAAVGLMLLLVVVEIILMVKRLLLLLYAVGYDA